MSNGYNILVDGQAIDAAAIRNLIEGTAPGVRQLNVEPQTSGELRCVLTAGGEPVAHTANFMEAAYMQVVTPTLVRTLLDDLATLHAEVLRAHANLARYVGTGGEAHEVITAEHILRPIVRKPQP